MGEVVFSPFCCGDCGSLLEHSSAHDVETGLTTDRVLVLNTTLSETSRTDTTHTLTTMVMMMLVIIMTFTIVALITKISAVGRSLFDVRHYMSELSGKCEYIPVG